MSNDQKSLPKNQDSEYLRKIIGELEEQNNKFKLLLEEKEMKETAMNSFFEEMKFEVINMGEDDIEFEKENLLKLLSKPAEAPQISLSKNKDNAERFLPF